MQKLENNHMEYFASAEEMVNSLSDEEVIAICPGTVEMKEKIAWYWFVLFVGLGVVCGIFSIDIEGLMNGILAVIGLYMLCKGFRKRPDCFAATKDNLIVIAGVLYNKKSDMYSYLNAYIVPLDSVKKCWNFRFGTVYLKLAKGTKARLSQGLFFRAKKYYTSRCIKLKQMKQIIFH